MDEPPVKLEIRTGGSKQPYAFRFEDDWPIPRTQWTKFYLRIDRPGSEDPRAVEGELGSASPQKTATLSYMQSAPTRPGKMPRGVSFETLPMSEDIEITGPIVLNVWVSSTGEDTDLFATLRNIVPTARICSKSGSRKSRCNVSPKVGCVPRIASSIRASRCRIGRITRTTNASGCGPARSSNAKSKSGRPRWYSRRGTSCGSTSHPRMASARSTSRTFMPTTTKVRKRRSTRAATNRPTYCCQ